MGLKLYSIDQTPQPFAASTTTLDGQTVKFAVDLIGGSYEGTLSADGNTIVGKWSQGATHLPLTLVHATKETALEIPAAPPPIKRMAADADPSFEVATIKLVGARRSIRRIHWTYPQVGINFYDHVVTDSGSGSHPAHSMPFHPRGSRLAIIAWRSPDDYTIDMMGDMRSLYPTLDCGDGVRWTIERGTIALASGVTSLNTGSGFSIKKLNMAKGEAIYFIADPKTTDTCDTTLVSVAITARDSK